MINSLKSAYLRRRDRKVQKKGKQCVLAGWWVFTLLFKSFFPKMSIAWECFLPFTDLFLPWTKLQAPATRQLIITPQQNSRKAVWSRLCMPDADQHMFPDASSDSPQAMFFMNKLCFSHHPLRTHFASDKASVLQKMESKAPESQSSYPVSC